MTVDIISRPGFWNIPLWGIICIYILGIAACIICGIGIYKSYLLWQVGKPVEIESAKKVRWGFLVKDALKQDQIRSKPLGSWLHFWIFWGFVFLFFGTAFAVLDWDICKLIFGKQFLTGSIFYLYKFVLDVAGLVCLIGLGMAFYRRFIKEGRQFEKSSRFLMIQGSLTLIIITGFIVEALRIAGSQPASAVYSPVGSFIASVFYSNMSPESIKLQHTVMWLFHGIISLIFVALIPFTYFAHIFKSPISIYWRKTSPRGNIPRIKDIEEQESFGVSKLNQFTWLNRINFDACTECGRCVSVCPVNRAGGSLDPRAIIQSLKNKLNGDYKSFEEPLIGGEITTDALLSCTTCGACVEQCPSKIDIVNTIVDMRRSVTMEDGKFAPGVAKTLQNISSVGNPWGLDPDSRFDWTKGLDVPFAEPNKRYDILYWVGCSAAFDKRSQKIAKAMVKILKASGLSFAIMREESCNAEFARRVGEEYLFECQTIANIENLRKYTFNRILCHCPHCFNTLKNDYPDFEGGRFNVISHTQFLAEQLNSRRIRSEAASDKIYAFHDPCYLARYNGIISEPRDALSKVKNTGYANPKEWGCNTTCCGAAGGQFWTDQATGERLNVIRLNSMINQTGKTDIATACPFCLSMFDSAKSQDRSLSAVNILDIAEIVAQQIKD